MSSANPSACCGTTVSCCINRKLADRLTATVENLFNCNCAEMTTIPLVLDPSFIGWQGAKTLGSCLHPVKLILNCGGSLCSDFSLALVGGASGPRLRQQANPNDGCSCKPLNLVFDLEMQGINCCGKISAAKIRVTVTT